MDAETPAIGVQEASDEQLAPQWAGSCIPKIIAEVAGTTAQKDHERFQILEVTDFRDLLEITFDDLRGEEIKFPSWKAKGIVRIATWIHGRLEELGQDASDGAILFGLSRSVLPEVTFGGLNTGETTTTPPPPTTTTDTETQKVPSVKVVVPTFDCNESKWPRFKESFEAAMLQLRLSETLEDPDASVEKKQLLYGHLATALAGSTGNKTYITKFRESKDGYEVWQHLLRYFESKGVRTLQATIERRKVDSVKVNERMSASQAIHILTDSFTRLDELGRGYDHSEKLEKLKTALQHDPLYLHEVERIGDLEEKVDDEDPDDTHFEYVKMFVRRRELNLNTEMSKKAQTERRKLLRTQGWLPNWNQGQPSGDKSTPKKGNNKNKPKHGPKNQQNQQGQRQPRDRRQRNRADDSGESKTPQEPPSEDKPIPPTKFNPAERKPKVRRIIVNCRRNNVNRARDDGIFEATLDSGADQCVISIDSGWTTLTQREHEVELIGADGSVVGKSNHIVTAAAGIRDADGNVYVALINEAIAVESMPESLLQPLQLRKAGVDVYDNTDEATNPEGPRLNIAGVVIPLKKKGPSAVLEIFPLSEDELDEYETLELTNPSRWDPETGTNVVRRTTLGIKKKTWSKDELRKWGRLLNIRDKANIRKTLESTTCLAEHEPGTLLRRHFKRRFPQLGVNRLKGTAYTDTFELSVPSVEGYTKVQLVHLREANWTWCYPMKREADFSKILNRFVIEVGAPDALRADNAQAETSDVVKNLCTKYGILRNFSEPKHQWQNRAENAVGKVKDAIRHLHSLWGAPASLWADSIRLDNELRQLRRTSERPTPFERLHGHTPDRSAFRFEFWEPIMYYDDRSFSKMSPGRWLGVATNTGDALTYRIMRTDGERLVRSEIRAMTHIEREQFSSQLNWLQAHLSSPIDDEAPIIRNTPIRQREGKLVLNMRDVVANSSPFPDPQDLAALDELIEDDSSAIPAGTTGDDSDSDDSATDDSDDEEDVMDTTDIFPDAAATRAGGALEEGSPGGVLEEGMPASNSENTAPLYGPVRGEWLSLLGRGIIKEFGDGVYSGRITDAYPEHLHVVYDDGEEEDLSYEEVLACLAPEKERELYSYERILDMTPKKVRLLWNDGSCTWEPLASLRQTDPITVAEFITEQMPTHPARAWADRTLRRQRQAKTRAQLRAARLQKPTSMHGFPLPRNVKHAYELDREHGNTRWADAIRKEMQKLFGMGVFEFHTSRSEIPDGYQYGRTHMVFAVKTDGTHKARLVMGGDRIDAGQLARYGPVMSSASMRILLTFADRLGKKTRKADCTSAYCYANTREKVWTPCGPEFGEYNGMVAVLAKALYGLKTSGFEWAIELGKTLSGLGFTRCRGDECVWRKPIRREDGTLSYDWISTFVDDILVVADDPDYYLDILAETYELKDRGEVENHLGLIFHQKRDGYTHMSPSRYIEEKLTEIEEHRGGNPLRKYKTPLDVTYKPELDDSAHLDKEGIQYYQSLVGALNWIVTCGRIDIAFATSTLAKYNAEPREGHLDAAYHVFGYLRQTSSKGIVFNGGSPRVVQEEYTQDDLGLYSDAEEERDPAEPEPIDEELPITIFVDADHAHEQTTRRSVTGIVIYVGSTPVIWISKRQKTVSSSTYAAEFAALRTAVEQAISIRYMMRSFGWP